jgi:hypothetical protein
MEDPTLRAARFPSVVLVLLVAATAVSPFATLAQSGADLPGTTLTIDAVGSDGLAGLAVLTPRDSGTAANVLAVGAPAGTTAVIHAGTCAAIDPTPVGLLGDVGAAGQLSTIIPVPYTTVADGRHVVVFHAGLDLATALGCGQIPLVTTAGTPGPGGSQAPAASASAAKRYDSSTYGFGIGWAAPWTQLGLEAVAGIDAVRLSDGVSEVVVAGHQQAGGDATACVRDWEGRLLDSLRASRISDLAPVAGPDSDPGDAQRARGAYQFSLLTVGAPARNIIERVDCRRLSSGAVLELTIDIPADAIDAETAAVDALLAGLTTSAVVVTSTPTAVPATPAPPTPAPTAAPTPTADAGCASMDTWVPATLARIDQLKGLAADAGTAMNSGMEAYARQLADNSLSVQQLLQAQRLDAVPAAVQKVQEDLLRMYQLLADAYDLLSQAYRSGDTSLLQQGLGKANEAESLSSSSRRALREAASPCGITVPAA